MLKHEEKVKILEEDQRRKKIIDTITDNVAIEIKDAIQKKVQGIKNKLIGLLEEKREILSLPLTKAETLEMAKSALRENRRLYLDEFLAKHLSDCQTQNVDAPLSPRSFQLGCFFNDDYWKLIYAIIKEEDLEKAAKTLPDVGLSSAERNAQIKALDAKIAALEGQIEKELKKL